MINGLSTWHCQGLSTATFWWKLLYQRINLTHKTRMAHIFTGFCHKSLTVAGKHNKTRLSEYFSFPSKSFRFSCIYLNDNRSRCVSMKEPLHFSGLLDENGWLLSSETSKVVTMQTHHLHLVLIWAKGSTLKIHWETYLYFLFSHTHQRRKSSRGAIFES